MPSLPPRLVDLLAIGRVANLPTVWSNVTVGLLFGFVSHSLIGPPDLRHAELDILLALVGATFAYLFGTFLNDWHDADFDARHRPERAIPGGRFRRRTILNMALAFALGALACLVPLGFLPLLTGALLLAAIVVYTLAHKRTPLAVVPMGLCRALLYLLGFLSIDVRPDLFVSPSSPGLLGIIDEWSELHLLLMAAGIASYVAGLSLAARYESRPETLPFPKAVVWFLLWLPLLTHAWWWLWQRPPFLEGWHLAIPALIGLVPFVLWTARALVVLKRSIPDFVSRALAGLCLLDLLAFPGIAALIRTPWPAVNAYPLLLALVPLTLFILALLLQRLAPAT